MRRPTCTSSAPSSRQLVGQHLFQAEERLGNHGERFSHEWARFPVSMPHEFGQDGVHRPGAMAEHGLGHRAELAERAMVFDDLEQRIVAEAAAAASAARIRPWHLPVASARTAPVGSASARWHTKCAVRLASRDVCQLLQQLSAIVSVGGFRAGIAGRVNRRARRRAHRPPVRYRRPAPSAPRWCGLLAWP